MEGAWKGHGEGHESVPRRGRMKGPSGGCGVHLSDGTPGEEGVEHTGGRAEARGEHEGGGRQANHTATS